MLPNILRTRRIWRLMGIFCICNTLTACATHEEAGAGTGAIIGGLIGALAGHGHADQGLAIMAGAIMGGLIGGDIGRDMDRQDQQYMQDVLERNSSYQSSGWDNPDTGRHYVVTPIRTYEYNRRPCREYTVEATIEGRRRDVRGTACRDEDGYWRATR